MRALRVFRRTLTSASHRPLGAGDIARYDGAVNTKYTETLKLHDPLEVPRFDTYRVIDEHGKFISSEYKLQLDKDKILEMYRMMVKISILDEIFNAAQRQGRISFYMTAAGEEAIHIGSAEPLSMEDVVSMQYREAGVLMWRGFSLQNVADQCFSNEADTGKGRQMPVHYGSKALNVQTVSSPLTTQVPQAAGTAYALTLEKKDAIAITYFGEGAASEGDFHSALNFAATLKCPVIFFCRNNGFAISTPTSDQYGDLADGIIGRAAGYGIHAMRVDGNDILAVNDVTRLARKSALEMKRPVFIEAMTYRAGHHSTSDDSTRYRDSTEMTYWEKVDNPIARCFLFLKDKDWITEEEDKDYRDQCRSEVMDAFSAAAPKLKPQIDDLFSDVYDEIPWHLKEQRAELLEHIQKYPDHYKVHEYK